MHELTVYGYQNRLRFASFPIGHADYQRKYGPKTGADPQSGHDR